MNEKLIELKAKAYDALAMVEAWQRELQSINAQIAEVQKAIREKSIPEIETEEK